MVYGFTWLHGFTFYGLHGRKKRALATQRFFRIEIKNYLNLKEMETLINYLNNSVLSLEQYLTELMLSAFVNEKNKNYSAERVRVPLFKFNIKIMLFERILKLVQREKLSLCLDRQI